MRQMGSKGYRLNEPLDDFIEYKHPRALKQAITLLLTEGNMSEEDLLHLFIKNKFAVSSNVFEELLDLEANMLSTHMGNKVVDFPTIKD